MSIQLNLLWWTKLNVYRLFIRAPLSSSMQDLLKDIVPSPLEGIERPSRLPEELRKADKATATSPEAKPEKTHRVKFFRRIFRFNKATSTQEDQQSPDPSRPTVKGPDPKNVKGPSSRNILYVHNFFIFIPYSTFSKGLLLLAESHILIFDMEYFPFN